MDITEIRKKRDKLESDLFDLIYQFTVNTGIAPREIILELTEITGKTYTVKQVTNCIVKLEV